MSESKQTAGPTAPRLQLRWSRNEVHDAADRYFPKDWACHYELVLPLGEHDIRREVYEDGEQVAERDELVLLISGPTLRGSTSEPCRHDDGSYHFDTPYRDGVHAQWDAPHLGNLPIYAIAIDGTAIAKPVEEARAAIQKATA